LASGDASLAWPVPAPRSPTAKRGCWRWRTPRHWSSRAVAPTCPMPRHWA